MMTFFNLTLVSLKMPLYCPMKSFYSLSLLEYQT